MTDEFPELEWMYTVRCFTCGHIHFREDYHESWVRMSDDRGLSGDGIIDEDEKHWCDNCNAMRGTRELATPKGCLRVDEGEVLG